MLQGAVSPNQLCKVIPPTTRERLGMHKIGLMNIHSDLVMVSVEHLCTRADAAVVEAADERVDLGRLGLRARVGVR